MSERTQSTSRDPCWVELSYARTWTPSIEFYGALFGWDVPESRERRADRRLPAGDEGRQADRGDDAADAGGPAAAWATYVSVEDAEATAAAVDGGRRHA